MNNKTTFLWLQAAKEVLIVIGAHAPNSKSNYLDFLEFLFCLLRQVYFGDVTFSRKLHCSVGAMTALCLGVILEERPPWFK